MASSAPHVDVRESPASKALAASRLRSAGELAGLIGGMLAIMWITPLTPWRQIANYVIAGALVALLVVSQRRERADRRELGFRFDNLLPVLGRLAPVLAGLVLVVVVIGLTTDSIRLGTRFLTMLAGVPFWGLLQQYLLLGFCHRRIRVLLGRGRGAVFATAALFGLMHLPNPVLALVCTLGGWVWAREFDRSPNLFAHAITHGIGSAFLANSLPRAILKNMVVGYQYLGG